MIKDRKEIIEYLNEKENYNYSEIKTKYNLDDNNKIHIIFENELWAEPLNKELDKIGVPYENIITSSGFIDLNEEPSEGIYFSRMSASSHTRGNINSPEFTGVLLKYLENNGKKVINGSEILKIELDKAYQYLLLKNEDINYPYTKLASNEEELIKASSNITGDFITKHNRAGKGLGVYLFNNKEQLKEKIISKNYEKPIDGLWLIQKYIKSPESFITRCEFIGGEFIYAVRVDTSDGFELCPADSCQLSNNNDVKISLDINLLSKDKKEKFEIIQNFEHPLIDKYKSFIKNNNLGVVAFEFITDKEGNYYTYDVNTNSNYNIKAEKKAEVKSAYKYLADFLVTELILNQ